MVDLADHQHDNHHRDNGDGQADEGNLDKRGDDIVDEGHNRDGHSVGQLSGHVVQVVALSAGGRHDRGRP